jgi:hypothetical protein
MKHSLSTLFLATTIALTAAGAHAANAQPDTRGLTRAQVKAQLYQAFLNGTTAADEKTSYPSPPSDRAEIAAQRVKVARENPSYANFSQ